METNTNKVLLGKILGEIYRIQKYIFCLPCTANDTRVYGLLNGIEQEIDTELKEIGFISNEKLVALETILEEYGKEENLDSKNYSELEKKFKQREIDRKKAIVIMKYLYTKGSIAEVIEEMESLDLPIEFQNFQLDDYDL